MLEPFDFQSKPKLVFGVGSLARLGELSRDEGFERVLFVTDPGLLRTPHVDRALRYLKDADLDVIVFSDFGENPDTAMVEAGRRFAADKNIDSVIGFGGGSSMDCAKGINFLLTNGGVMNDYLGRGKNKHPLLPMIGVPTTAGTGSESQTYALISDAETHLKMACSDDSAAFRVALLDPELTLSQPPEVTAVTGYDALSHAVETFVTRRRNPLSDVYSREAFGLLDAHYLRVLEEPEDIEARAAMQLGAFYAGVAIENSMLGATHACANPLTKNFGTAHGRAIALCLPAVVRWNGEQVGDRYRELLASAGHSASEAPGDALALRLETLAEAGGLPRGLSSQGVSESDLPKLAREASEQWTGTFNPRSFDGEAALEIYREAF